MLVIPILLSEQNNVRPRSLDPFYIVTYCIKWVKTSWTDSILDIKKAPNNHAIIIISNMLSCYNIFYFINQFNSTVQTYILCFHFQPII